MIEITVLFFATFIDRAGLRRATIQLPQGASVADLKAHLPVQFPGLAGAMGSVLVAIEREFAFDEELIPDGAEVAVFPPVSGGGESLPQAEPVSGGGEPLPQAEPVSGGGESLPQAERVSGGEESLPDAERVTIFFITPDELDLDDLLAQLTNPATGAACFFSGMVRGVTRRGAGHQTSYLEYEAYQPMAEAKMRQVADEMRARWPSLDGIAIVQRVGRLAPGTPTVLIACTAAHRDTGVFEAARYGIDRLKEIVPVWKKEVGPDGAEWVEGDYMPERTD